MSNSRSTRWYFAYPTMLAVLLLGLGSQPAAWSQSLNAPAQIKASIEQPDHRQWDRLLKRHVDARGMVDYKGFAGDKALLEDYLLELSAHSPKDHWSHSQKLAYYINTYNAYTIKLILQNYPVVSIKDIASPWGQKLIPLDDRRISLDYLENKILRKLGDARIHFAINCASYSCPRLHNEAFTADKLEKQLQMVSSQFINGPRNNLDPKAPKLSAIFKWYRRDFVVDGKVDVIAFVNQFAKVKIDSGARLSYLDYNWQLNEKQP